MDLIHFIHKIRSSRKTQVCAILALFIAGHIDFSQSANACGSALETSTRYDLNDPQYSSTESTGFHPERIDQESIEIDFVPRPSNDSTGCGLSKNAQACVSTAGLQIRFRPPYDRDTPPEQLGYRIEVIGDLPSFVEEGIHGSQYYAPEGTINLEFYGSADLARQLLIVLRPLDPEGNVGDASEAVAVNVS